jgi:hypothetical protein
MCTLTTILSCFSLTGFYVTADIKAVDRGQARWQQVDSKPANGDLWFKRDGRYFTASTEPDNPYVFAAIGYSLELWDEKITLNLIQIAHESSPMTNSDRGRNSIATGITWRPFK